jgi:hypothetical protein
VAATAVLTANKPSGISQQQGQLALKSCPSYLNGLQLTVEKRSGNIKEAEMPA